VDNAVWPYVAIREPTPANRAQKISETQLLAYDHSVIWLEAVGCERDRQVVLDTVTMGVARSELIIVEGCVASGKSTLLEIAAVRRLPDRGTVWFAGRNISTLQRASLPFVRRNIGYAAPDSLLLGHETALANVMLALAVRGQSPSDAEAAGLEAFALIGAGELATRKVGALSSGQQRLVSFARAIAGPPPLVIVDEPAALADDETRQRIVSALSAIRDSGSAVLCGTAETSLVDRLVQQGGRKINLAEGRIVGAPPVELVPAFTPEPIERTGGQPRIITLEVDDSDEGLPPASRGPV
jgi:cell division transport system ATP-binding protein